MFMVRDYIPLAITSHFSLLKSTLKPDDIKKELVNREIPNAVLSDINSLSGSIQCVKALKGTGIKPILGVNLDIVTDSFIKDKNDLRIRPLGLIARNYDGWKQLIAITNSSYSAENYFQQPRLDLLKIESILNNKKGNIIAYSGRPGSDLANCLFKNPYTTYHLQNDNAISSAIDGDWKIRAVALIRQHQILFGAENFYVEVNIDKQRPYTRFIAEMLRETAAEVKCPTVYVNPIHYSRSEFVEDCRLVAAIGLKKVLPESRKIAKTTDDVFINELFHSNTFSFDYQPDLSLYSQEELKNTIEITEKCEEYTILSPPKLPTFNCPNGLSQADYLKQLCREGWKAKLQNKVKKEDVQRYVDRVKYELETIEKANISGYFLIVQDYIKAAEKRGELVGKGRGSAAGCLVSYLTGITGIDPLDYDLIFERFYNAGRAAEGQINYPDIDVDFESRDNVIKYIKEKYGSDNVAYICTFGRLQGRGAIKEVLRLHGKLSFTEINEISKVFPDESKIAGELQEMREEDEDDATIIKWTLENDSKSLSNWCRLTDNGELEGDLAAEFGQAIRLEGIKKTISRHASGLVIFPEILRDNIPLVKSSSSNELIVGFEFKDAESAGAVKVDVLGVNILNKLAKARELLQNA